MKKIAGLGRNLVSLVKKTSGKIEYKNGGVTGDILNVLLNLHQLENKYAGSVEGSTGQLQELFCIGAIGDEKEYKAYSVLKSLFSHYGIYNLLTHVPGKDMAAIIQHEGAPDDEREEYESIHNIPEAFFMQNLQDKDDVLDILLSNEIDQLFCSSNFLGALPHSHKYLGMRLLEDIKNKTTIDLIYMDNYRKGGRWKDVHQAKEFFVEASAYARCVSSSMSDAKKYYNFDDQFDVYDALHTKNNQDASLLLTNSADDVYLFDGMSREPLLHTPAEFSEKFSGRPFDTVGAGDAFISSFVFFINLGVDPKKSLSLADQVAQVVLRTPRDNLGTHVDDEHLTLLPEMLIP